MRVMIVVTHLLGAGHLNRSLTLGRAFAAAGHEAVVVSGGRPAPQLLRRDKVRLIQIPSAASDGLNFRRLLDAEGREIDAGYRARRIAALQEVLRGLPPDALITELFPFGRRTLSAEFDALLAAAVEMRPRPLILASVRDIMETPGQPDKIVAAHARIARSYDGVLVHGDPDFLPLTDSWPLDPATTTKLRYTGYVAPPPPRPGSKNDKTDDKTDDGAGEVLVAVGGGPVGRALLDTATAAAAVGGRRWRLLPGGAEAARIARELTAQAEPSALVIAEPARADYREMLTRAACSVSMVGYNTALDLLQTGVPAVLCPFDEGGEREQTQRAEALIRAFPFQLLRSARLNPESLAAAVETAIDAGGAPPGAKQLGGARRTVEIVEQMAAARG